MTFVEAARLINSTVPWISLERHSKDISNGGVYVSLDGEFKVHELIALVKIIEAIEK